MGLRFKLGLYVVVFVCSTLAVVGYFRMQAERQIYRDEARNRGVSLLRSLAIPCTTAMANNDTPALDNFVSQFAAGGQSMDLSYLAVLDYNRRIVAHTQPGRFGTISEDSFSIDAASSSDAISRVTTLEGEPVLEVAVPVVSGLRWGTLLAGFSLARLERDLAARGMRAAIAGLVIALSAGALAFWTLSILVIAPILKMGAMARRVGAGELGARVYGIARDDEVGQLSIRMNKMADELQRYTHSLEGLVEDRTLELAWSNQQLSEVNAQLERLAREDSLTGLANRRYFMAQLDSELARGKRISTQFTLIMLDVDYFKNYNDTNGHQAGDDLLTLVAQLIKQGLRATDLVGRYGGEEFIIVLLDTGLVKGSEAARKVQCLVAETPLPFDEGQPGGKLTVSIGLSSFPGDGESAKDLIERADQALYLSKHLGRNRVSTWADVHRSGVGVPDSHGD